MQNRKCTFRVIPIRLLLLSYIILMMCLGPTHALDTTVCYSGSYAVLHKHPPEVHNALWMMGFSAPLFLLLVMHEHTNHVGLATHIIGSQVHHWGELWGVPGDGGEGDKSEAELPEHSRSLPVSPAVPGTGPGAVSSERACLQVSDNRPQTRVNNCSGSTTVHFHNP